MPICANQSCRKVFTSTRRSKAKPQRFCSRKCGGQVHRKEAITLTCQRCGEPFTTYPCRSSQTRCSRSCPGPKVFWSKNLAYVVGLIASDGCLQRGDVKRISIASSDHDHLKVIQSLLPHSKLYGPNKGCYQVSVTWPRLYDLLIDIGLHPKKSLSLGPLSIPNHLFFDFIRGVIDGDGSVSYNRGYLSIAICSYAKRFRAWLHSKLESHGIGSLNSHKRRTLELHGANARSLAEKVWRPGGVCLERKRPK